MLKKLNDENLAVNLQKCEFVKEDIVWLGFKLTPNGVTPTKPNCVAILKLDEPKTLKQLRSFMGCIHHLIKFLPNLAHISEPLCPLLSKTNTKSQNKLAWNDTHTEAFNKIKAQIQSITENKHFDTNKQTRFRCDASKKGLGACLEQKHENIWKPVAYASRFLNKLDERYNTNELELLAVVWLLEHFKYYLYGSQFLLQTDHQALLSALKENRGNKTYQSRLTSWVDRLLPFHFTVEHVPGKNMGFADYLSRNPSGVAPTPNIEDNNFVINAIDESKINLIKNDLTPNGVNAHSSDTKQVYNNDVIYLNQTRSDQNNAFSLNTHRLQSHSFHPNLFTASKFNSQKVQINSTNSINPEIVTITTRNNPNKETYSTPILKRPRAPNKKLQMETETNQPKNRVNLSTQTEGHSNKGRGLDPIDPSKHQELFTAHSVIPTPA